MGCWQSLGSTASNCGKGLPKVLQQLRQGCRICSAVGSVMLVTVAGLGSVPVAFRLGSVAVRPGCPCLAWVRPAVLCRWLPVGCPSWVLVLVDGAGVPPVLLSALSLLPHLLRLFFVVWVFPFSPCNPFFTFSLLLSCIIYIILYIRKIIIYNLFFTFGLFLILYIRNLNYNSQCYILVLLNKNSILVIFNY